MSGYTLVESKKARKSSSKQNIVKKANDDYEATLVMIESEDMKTYQRIKSQIASQLSDTDGVDASQLPTPTLIARGQELLTKDNPTGQPPGINGKDPTMLNLLTRLQAQAGIVKRNVQQPASSARKSTFPTFPPGRGLAMSHKARQSAAKGVTFTTAIKPLVLEKKERSTKQYAMSTIQQPRYARAPGTRGCCPVDRLGAFNRGQKQFATSALDIEIPKNQHTNTEDEQDQNDSDQFEESIESDLEISEPPSKKTRNDDEAFMLTGYPLLPSTPSDVEEDIKEDRIDIDDYMEEYKDGGPPANVDTGNRVDTNIVPAADQLYAFALDESETLRIGFNPHSFYDCVEQLPEGVYSYRPPVNDNRTIDTPELWKTKHQLQAVPDGDHVMTPQEKLSCENEEIRQRYHYLCHRCFWQKETVDELKDSFDKITGDNHMDIVMLGEGFTNSVWDHTNTMQYDVQKLWYHLKEFGQIDYGTITPKFGTTPITEVTLDYLLMLPIPAVFGYLEYHAVDTARIPWRVKAEPAVLQQLSVQTRVPFLIWKNYLVVLLDYLHGLLQDEEEAFSMMHIQFMVKREPTVTNQDAQEFVQQHFPDEARSVSLSPVDIHGGDYLSLLKRASAFAKSRKYKGEVYYSCTEKWLFYLYFILHNSYPPDLPNKKARFDHCVSALAASVSNRDRMVLDIGRLLKGHHSGVSAMLQDHVLAHRLYGPSATKASVGIQMLMAAGVTYMYFWLLYNAPSVKEKRRNIDEVLPQSILAYILSARGILAPMNDNQPVFESDRVPIHYSASAQETAAELIRSMEPCVLSLPPSTIPIGMTDEDYRSHYERPLGMDKGAKERIKQRELADFFKSSQGSHELATGPCWFPVGKTIDLSNTPVGSEQSYLVEAGRRLVGLIRRPAYGVQLGGRVKGASTFTSSSVSSAKKGPPLKQSFLINNNGSIEISRTLPTVTATGIADLKRTKDEQQVKPAQELNSQRTKAGQVPPLTPRYKSNINVVNVYNECKDAKAMYSTDWTKLTIGFDGNDKYLSEMRFFSQESRPVQKGDKMIMLYDVNRVMTSLFDCSHLLYTVYTVVGNRTYSTLTESLWQVGESHEESLFPEKAMLDVPGPYILFEELEAAETPAHSKSRNTGTGAQSNSKTIDDDTSSGVDDDGDGSEDSEAKRIAKTSSIKVGRMTYKVVDEHETIRDSFLKAGKQLIANSVTASTQRTYASAWKKWTVFMQLCHHNPTEAVINCAGLSEDKLVKLLIMFVTYCLDNLHQQPTTVPGILSGLRHSFRSRFITETAFDNVLLGSLKAGVSRLPSKRRTRLPYTYDMVQYIIYKNTQGAFVHKDFRQSSLSQWLITCACGQVNMCPKPQLQH